MAERRRRLTQRIGLSLSFIFMACMATVMTIQTGFPKSKIHLLIQIFYLVIITILNFALTNTFSKLIIGTITSYKGPHSNPYHPIHAAQAPQKSTRCAIVYPVYHEDVAAVSARIAASWESITEKFPDYSKHYDFFLISDSRKLSYKIAEEAAIYHLRSLFPEGRFYYRHRASNDHAKLGNVIDFCRRWSSSYQYMWMMDADSLVDGSVIHTTLCMMEGNARLGILQTNPLPIMRTSIFGRMQQFTSHCVGPIFSYAMQALQMGHSTYVGHNAMIRTKAFVQHCMLPNLSGESPWGGKPLSHDLLEAAKMSTAGYEVWLLPELEESYEEIPPNILGFLQRERRWMQGNLQHLRFLRMKGIGKNHKDILITGIMTYLSSPLWGIFLLISMTWPSDYMLELTIKNNIIGEYTLPSIILLISSIVFLFLPRIFALFRTILTRSYNNFGGLDKVIISTLLETIFFFFASPIIMMFISKFIWMWAKKKAIRWGTQKRDDEALTLQEAWRDFGWVSACGIAATFYVIYRATQTPEQTVFLFILLRHHIISAAFVAAWLAPILLGLIFAPWIALYSSKSSYFSINRKIFSTPVEINIPSIIIKNKKFFDKLITKIPDPEDDLLLNNFYFSDDLFIKQHDKITRNRPIIRNYMLPIIKNNTEISEKELSVIITEKTCFREIVQKKRRELNIKEYIF
nr:glucans biosynthesis glucosyltransferase MdoH [uncultured Neokomagataea sp.]